MTSPVLIFDLDGTLVDTAPDILATLARILREFGFDPAAGKISTTMIGRGSRRMIEEALAALSAKPGDDLVSRMHAAFLEDYGANICVESRLYPGALDCLERFAAGNWRLAVCTNKLESLSLSLLEQLSIADRFAAICAADTVAAGKPSAEHLLETLRRAGGSPEPAVMVGDSASDVGAARAAGVAVAGVTFGYTPTPMHLLEPDILVSHFDELTLATAAGLIGKRPVAPSAKSQMPADAGRA